MIALIGPTFTVINHVAAGLAAAGMVIGAALVGYGLWHRRNHAD